MISTNKFCNDYNDHQEIQNLVEKCWSAIGTNIIHGKLLKRGDKLQSLISDVGYFGPNYGFSH